MNVAIPQPGSDLILDSLRSAGQSPHRLLFISAPPGFGKSSTLRAAGQMLESDLSRPLVWISGGIIAGTSHFVRSLAAELGEKRLAHLPLPELISEIASNRSRFILAVDDLDSLIFKREEIADSLATLITVSPEVRVLGSGNASAAERVVGTTGTLGRTIPDKVFVVGLRPLDDASAVRLIRRRAPRIGTGIAKQVIAAAGGHPAALVFLARLAQLNLDEAKANFTGFLEVASEFAGAVYAESWTSLGPQQRALLWQLSDGIAKTAADVADATGLPSSHVSSQFTRLLAEGLVGRGSERGQFKLAPLLSAWIVRRAARSPALPSKETETASGFGFRVGLVDGIPTRTAGRKRHGRV
jgi:hypothetical protein